VGDRSSGRFATPADFPLHDCSPYSHADVRRLVWDSSLVQGPFSVAPCQTLSVTVGNFCIALYGGADLAMSITHASGMHANAARASASGSCASRSSQLACSRQRGVIERKREGLYRVGNQKVKINRMPERETVVELPFAAD
jgi:hypothetical protein